MNPRIFPIARAADTLPQHDPQGHDDGREAPLDRLGRGLHDLRISVTDRCNFRCLYCMPRAIFDQDYRYLPHREILNFDEIVRVARIFVAQGVKKLRLTGGEPLLRKDIEVLIAMLAEIKTPLGEPVDIAMTTNASLLARKAAALKAAGLSRLTVSLDALDDTIFKRMNDADFAVADVLDGIAAAHAAGFASLKINMVVQRGINDGEVLAMAEHFRGTPDVLRFIEYMDVGTSNGWVLDQVVSGEEIVARIAARHPVSAIAPTYPGEVASRFTYQDGEGEIGVITSVTHPFCGSCTRARMSTEGKIFTCLFSAQGTDVRALLRSGQSDQAITGAMRRLWRAREDRYSEVRGQATTNVAKVEMSYIGG